MIRKYLLSLLAIAGFLLAVYTVMAGNRPLPVAPAVAPPAKSPYASFVAGSGIIEASTRNLAVGTLVAGVVSDLFVEVGDNVTAGDPLFRIDARDLEAELAVRQALVATAQARLDQLSALPRAEDVPPAEARLVAAEAALADARSQLEMWQGVGDRRAVSQEELDRKRFSVDVATARLVEARAQLDLLKAGAWKADIDVARAERASTEAQVRQTQVDIDRRTVRAPVTGQVLQLNIRAGEFAAIGVLERPLVLLGNVERLEVRVDVDENDAWRIHEGARATAFLRGNSSLRTPVQFVRFEPYVVPKRSLTGAGTERVDTRVLQILFSFSRSSLPVFVGQQVDVFIEAPPVTGLDGPGEPAGSGSAAPSSIAQDGSK